MPLFLEQLFVFAGISIAFLWEKCNVSMWSLATLLLSLPDLVKKRRYNVTSNWSQEYESNPRLQMRERRLDDWVIDKMEALWKKLSRGGYAGREMVDWRIWSPTACVLCSCSVLHKDVVCCRCVLWLCVGVSLYTVYDVPYSMCMQTQNIHTISIYMSEWVFMD